MYNIYMYKSDVALNNPLEVICHKTQPKQRKSMLTIVDYNFTSDGYFCWAQLHNNIIYLNNNIIIIIAFHKMFFFQCFITVIM